MKATVYLLHEYHQPLVRREVEIPALTPGQVLVKLVAGGICGSDPHMFKGEDSRLRLPMILDMKESELSPKLVGSNIADLFNLDPASLYVDGFFQLLAGFKFKTPPEIDPAVLVAASCSGATNVWREFSGGKVFDRITESFRSGRRLTRLPLA